MRGPEGRAEGAPWTSLFSTPDRCPANCALMDKAAFLKVASQFRLGHLTTEQAHPETLGLADWAQRSLPRAISAFHKVDCLAMEALSHRLEPLVRLVSSMRQTLEANGRIFLCGCGATGRLALSLEALARQNWLGKKDPDRVLGFMAGGDAALIRSLEAFEDFPGLGKRQLLENGFGENDLLLAITEGGETPFVIGACEAAAEIAVRHPWFLFCNKVEELAASLERSRAILENDRVEAFCLEVGPMALAGSTRLQATTVQMLVAGAALSEALGHERAADLIAAFKDLILAGEPQFLDPFIESEARLLQQGDHLLYMTEAYGVTVLTDTTERSPTFSIPPFESRDQPEVPSSPWYLSLPETDTAETAWRKLLGRDPRTLEWPELDGRGSRSYLLSHDISGQAAVWRRARCPDTRQVPFLVHGRGPVLELGSQRVSLGLGDAPVLLQHLALKCRLNLHSTLVMGRLGRYESNLMTWVRPANYKLIDRAARYRQIKHKQETGIDLAYGEAVDTVFADLENRR